MTIVFKKRVQWSVNCLQYNWNMTSAIFLIICFVFFSFYVCYVSKQTLIVDYYLSSLQLTTQYSLMQMREFALKNTLKYHFKQSLYSNLNYSFNRMFKNSVNRFNISKNDVMVFLHIQKTAGTFFEKYLVKYLNISHPCYCTKKKKRCKCSRSQSDNETWLFSRFSTGWKCGLHSDFTEMLVSSCVEHVFRKKDNHRDRRYFFTTFLRDPVKRFISEFHNVKKGSNWLATRHVCNESSPLPEHLPLCFDPEVGWKDVVLNDFLACPYNLAFNRQTRMLADLTLINCYDWSSMNKTQRENIMLESAKKNLKKLGFFGINERMTDSQFLFESIFDLKFNKSLFNQKKKNSGNLNVSSDQLKIINELNALDIYLYKFALELFKKQLSFVKSGNPLELRYFSFSNSHGNSQI